MLQKTVLTIQPSRSQGKIWQAALESQQLVVIWEAEDFPLVEALEYLKKCGADLPELLLIDLENTVDNVYKICRWCREHCPSTKVILTKADRAEISSSERYWAIAQGALDLLPGLKQEVLLTNAVSGISRILEVLNCLPLNQEALIECLYLLTSQKAKNDRLVASPQIDVFTASLITTEENNNIDGQFASPKTIEDKKKKISSLKPKKRYRGVAY